MGLLSRIRRRLRPSDDGVDPPAGSASQDAGNTELGTNRLPDGTVLERCLVVDLATIQAVLAPGQRDQLRFFYVAGRHDEAAHDLHELRELHLYYSQLVDLRSIAWDLDPDVGIADSVRDAALAVDAFHRDHGLTWQSLVYDGRGGGLGDAIGLGDTALPRVQLVGRDGTVRFDRTGPWKDDDRRRLELLLTGR